MYDITNQEISSTNATIYWTKVSERPLFKLFSASDQWWILFLNVACRQVATVYPRRTLGALKLGRGIKIDYGLVYIPRIDI